MATAARSPADRDHECPVCVERYRDPRILECAHHFCKVCLEGIAEHHPQGYITCPTCRQVTNTDDVTNLSRYSIVNDFVGSVEIIMQENNQGTGDSANCDLCDDEIQKPAVLFCFSCPHQLCQTCSDEIHGTGVVHQLCALVPGMLCEEHDFRFKAFYCKDCQVMCCSRCRKTYHRSHEVEDSGTAGQRVKHEFIQMKDLIKRSTQEKRTLQRVHDKLSLAREAKNKLSHSMNVAREELKEVEKQLDYLNIEYNTKIQTEIKHLEMTAADLETYVGSVGKLEQLFTNLVNTGSELEILMKQKEIPQFDPLFYQELLSKPEVALPVVDDKLDQVAKSLRECRGWIDITWYSDSIDTAAASVPGNPVTKLTKLSSFCVGSNTRGLAIDSKKQRLIVRRCNVDVPVSLFDFNGKNLLVLGQGIPGIAEDYYQSVAFDETRNLFILPLSDGTLITLDENNKIKDTVKLDGQRHHDVCVHKQGFIFSVSADSKNICKIDRKDGTRVMDDSFHRAVASRVTFKGPHHVNTGDIYAGNQSIPVIFVSDMSAHCVHVLDMDGKWLHVFGNPGYPGSVVNQFHYCHGSCCDPAGRLLVCDQHNHRLVSVWKEEEETKFVTLLNKEQMDNKEYPRYVVFDPPTRKLFIGYIDGHINVYQAD